MPGVSAPSLLNRRINAYPQVVGDYSDRSSKNIFLGDIKKVLDDMERYEALVNDPNDSSSLSNVAVAYSDTAWCFIRTHREMGDAQIAVELLQKAHTHPHTLESWNNLVALYESWGKPEKTEEWQAKLAQIEDLRSDSMNSK